AGPQLGACLPPAAPDVHPEPMRSADGARPMPVPEFSEPRIAPPHQLRRPHGLTVGRDETSPNGTLVGADVVPHCYKMAITARQREGVGRGEITELKRLPNCVRP